MLFCCFFVQKVTGHGERLGIRTPDLRIRSPLLFPAELIALVCRETRTNINWFSKKNRMFYYFYQQMCQAENYNLDKSISDFLFCDHGGPHLYDLKS